MTDPNWLATQFEQHRAHLRLDRVSIARLKLIFEMMKPVSHLRVFSALVIQFRHAMRQRFHLRFHLFALRRDGR